MDFNEEEDACEHCGSHWFQIVDGRKTCSNGHVQEDGPVVGEDEADFGNQGKVSRVKDQRAKVKVLKVSSGGKAFKLYLQAYQLILWKQCYALIHSKGFRAELWTIVKDLWTLRLTRLFLKLEKPEKAKKSRPSEAAAESADDSDVEITSKSKDTPSLLDTISLCYIGLVLLRAPLSLSTLLRWVREEDLVYVRAIRHISKEISERLPAEYHEALEITPKSLSPDALQSSIFQLVRYYKKHFGTELPALNYQPLLYCFVERLALPIEVYQLAQNLNARIIHSDFTYDLDLARGRTTSFPEAQLIALVVIAVKICYPFLPAEADQPVVRTLHEPAALHLDWEVWTKIQHALHSSPNQQDKGPLKPSTALSTTDADIISMSPADLDAYMDWYQHTWLDTSRDANATGPRRDLLGMFPLQEITPSSDKESETRNTALERQTLKAVQRVQATLTHNPITPTAVAVAADNDDKDNAAADLATAPAPRTRRPGSTYALFRRASDLEHPIYSTHARAFHTAAAEVACLSLPTLLRAVAETERRIMVWRSARRRAERHKGLNGEMDVDVDVEVEVERAQTGMRWRRGREGRMGEDGGEVEGDAEAEEARGADGALHAEDTGNVEATSRSGSGSGSGSEDEFRFESDVEMDVDDDDDD